MKSVVLTASTDINVDNNNRTATNKILLLPPSPTQRTSPRRTDNNAPMTPTQTNTLTTRPALPTRRNTLTGNTTTERETNDNRTTNPTRRNSPTRRTTVNQPVASAEGHN
jgi:hypothetical protein